MTDIDKQVEEVMGLIDIDAPDAEIRTKLRTLLGAQSGEQAPVGYIHPQNLARLERGEPVAIRKNGWDGEPNQVSVYTHPAPAIEVEQATVNHQLTVDNAPQAVQAAVSDGWHKAVLDACMVTETCYVKADPEASVRNLIDWHASIAVEAAALTATQPAAQGVDAQQLHSEIINIRMKDDAAERQIGHSAPYAYKLGHRDARHAAAELVLTTQAKQKD